MIWQGLSSVCQTCFPPSRETPSDFNFKTALTYFHVNYFAVLPKEAWTFFFLIIPPIWQLITLRGQVVGRPHVWVSWGLPMCSYQVRRVWGVKDNVCCRTAECRRPSLSVMPIPSSFFVNANPQFQFSPKKEGAYLGNILVFWGLQKWALLVSRMFWTWSISRTKVSSLCVSVG